MRSGRGRSGRYLGEGLLIGFGVLKCKGEVEELVGRWWLVLVVLNSVRVLWRNGCKLDN